MAKFLYLSGCTSSRLQMSRYFATYMPDIELVPVSNTADAIASLIGDDCPEGIIVDNSPEYEIGFQLVPVLQTLAVSVPLVFYSTIPADLESVALLKITADPIDIVFQVGVDKPEEVIRALKSIARTREWRDDLPVRQDYGLPTNLPSSKVVFYILPAVRT